MEKQWGLCLTSASKLHDLARYLGDQAGELRRDAGSESTQLVFTNGTTGVCAKGTQDSTDSFRRNKTLSNRPIRRFNQLMRLMFLLRGFAVHVPEQ